MVGVGVVTGSKMDIQERILANDGDTSRPEEPAAEALPS